MHNGSEERLHTFENGQVVWCNFFLDVYLAMYAQVLMEYKSLPDPRTLELYEVKFYYDYLRPSLLKSTRPKDNG